MHVTALAGRRMRAPLPRGMATAASSAALSKLAPNGTMRAAINMSNILLVTDRTDPAVPKGVAPDLAAALAQALGAKLKLVPYSNPGALADAASRGEWDVGLIGAEPARATLIGFSAPYAEIEATYLVPPASALRSAAEVDAAGVRIASSKASAYTLWLSENLKHSAVVQTAEPGAEGSWELFRSQELDALAGLRPWLAAMAERLPGATVLPDRFTSIQQAVGIPRGDAGDVACGAAVVFLDAFVADAKETGLVAQLLARHGVSEKLAVAR